MRWHSGARAGSCRARLPAPGAAGQQPAQPGGPARGARSVSICALALHHKLEVQSPAGLLAADPISR